MSQSTRAPLSLIAKEKLGQTTRQLWLITKTFFKSERRGKANALLLVLLVLSVAYVGVIVMTSYASRDFITAIEKKDSHGYWLAMGRYIGTLGVAILINVYSRVAQQSLALLWREWMAQHHRVEPQPRLFP